MSVSYTHLDVYKRQEQQLAVSAVPPDLLEESGLVKTEDAEVSAQEDELCGYPLAPVSYTHLDVYKRQLLHQKK